MKKKNFLKTKIKISKPELDAAAENVNNKNEKIIIDIIDPTPGLFVDDKLNLNDQFKNNKNISKTYTLPKQLNKSLDDILEENCPPEIFKPKPIEKLPNSPLNIQESDNVFINDIYIDDDDDIIMMIIQDVPMFKPDDDIDFQIFPPPPIDDRDDFKIKADKEDLIIYKSPTLTTVNTISKEQLKTS